MEANELISGPLLRRLGEAVNVESEDDQMIVFGPFREGEFVRGLDLHCGCATTMTIDPVTGIATGNEFEVHSLTIDVRLLAARPADIAQCVLHGRPLYGDGVATRLPRAVGRFNTVFLPLCWEVTGAERFVGVVLLDTTEDFWAGGLFVIMGK